MSARSVLVPLVVLLALAAAAASAMLLHARAPADKAAEPGTPVTTSLGELQAAADKADAPIYWAGTRPGDRFELTRTKGGRTYVRYLPPGVNAGDKRPAFLTVATYPQRRAYPVTEAASRRRGMVRRSTPGGGLAVWQRRNQRSVYLAYPGSDQLVEVFSPSADDARRLVLAGDVGPIGEVAASEPAPRRLVDPR